MELKITFPFQKVMFEDVGSVIHSQSKSIKRSSFACNKNYGNEISHIFIIFNFFLTFYVLNSTKATLNTPQNRIWSFFETLANFATGNNLRRSDSRWSQTARKALQNGDYELLLLGNNIYSGLCVTS